MKKQLLLLGTASLLILNFVHNSKAMSDSKSNVSEVSNTEPEMTLEECKAEMAKIKENTQEIGLTLQNLEYGLLSFQENKPAALASTSLEEIEEIVNKQKIELQTLLRSLVERYMNLETVCQILSEKAADLD